MVESVEPAGQIIRQARDRAGLSQEEVAIALRVSGPAISQWENGRITPRRAIAIKLDELLRADGAIVRAMGYSATIEASTDDLAFGPDVRKALDLLAEISANLITMTDRVAAVEQAIDDIEARLDQVVPPDNGTPPQGQPKRR